MNTCNYKRFYSSGSAMEKYFYGLLCVFNCTLDQSLKKKIAKVIFRELRPVFLAPNLADSSQDREV